MAKDKTALQRGPARLVRWGRLQVDARASAANRWIADRREGNGLLDVAWRTNERDRLAAGNVTGSAVAFRLFLFFVPFLLFAVGILGFVAAFIDSGAVVKTSGITGKLAEQIEAAFSQPTSTRWLATGFGLVGMVTAGRALAKVLIIASALAWQVPIQRQKAVRVVGLVVGTTVAVALISALVNRVRESAGLAVAWLSFLPVVIIYIVAWSLLYLVLPRGTSDLSAVLPGAALFGITLAVMEAVTQLYLPGRFDHASALYGSIGVTVVTLGWFFFLGRVLVLSMTINAVVYERIGSVSIFIFGLPVLRTLPRRWPRVAHLIGLDQRDRHRGQDPGASKGAMDMASSERSARERYADHNVVAVYRTLDEARDAAAALNQAGLDVPHLELLDGRSPLAPLGGGAQHELDQRAVTRRIGRRAAIGAAIGAVVGVLVGLAIHLIFDEGNIVPEIVGALAGLLVGAALGAFYGGASGLPREGTFSDLRARRNGVAVHADEAELVERAVATLAPTSPELLARFGPDGHLRRVEP
jgi:uncharacterized BrkB/YihY/UPF0761 family membrane protein